MTHLTLPYPPTANRLRVPVRTAKGSTRHVSTPEHRSWLEAGQWGLKGQKFETINGPFRLTILARAPDRRKRDIDNLIKPLLDLIVKAKVVRDDSDAQAITIQWAAEPVKGGEIRVLIIPAERAA